MRAAIITYSDSLNWGAQLQAYALKTTLSDMGIKTNHIDHRKMNTSLYVKGKSIGALCNNFIAWKSRDAHRLRIKRTLDFRTKYLAMTEPCRTKEDMKALNDKYDIFITGSDQVWNCTNGINSNFYLDFVEDDNKKCAYAASFGISKLPKNYVSEVARRLSGYRYITVRENSGKNTIKDITNRNVEQVCDPVFLLKREEWRRFINSASDAELSKKGKYIFVYSTDNSQEFIKLVGRIKRQYKLPVISVSYIPGCRVIKDIGPAEFADYIMNAEAVVTTSFHATAFSLIFHKKLYVLPHKTTGNRVTDILNLLCKNIKMENQQGIISITDENYNVSDERLDDYRASSLEQLKKMVDGEELHKCMPKTIASFHEECTGCRVCEKVCPQKCIEFEKEDDGFIYPHIDDTRCIGCGKCVKMCHLTCNPHINEDKGVFGYARADDTRMKSSSGGAFSAIVETWKDENKDDNGFTVFGSVYDADTNSVYQKGYLYPDFEPLCQSKYAFSDPRNTFDELKCRLENGGSAVYCGTPCQISALYKFLGEKTYEKLITIDFICHGVPSESFMQQHIKHISNGKRVKNVEFRSKEHGWGLHNHCLKISYDDGKPYIVKAGKDFYFTHFLNNDCFRTGCYHCHYSYRHVSDFTLGDFWEVDRYRKDINDGKGISVIFANTPKAEKLLNSLENNMVLFAVPDDYHRSRNGSNPKMLGKKKEFDAAISNYTVERLEHKFKFERPIRLARKLLRLLRK